MTKTPRVSIVIPTYNQAALLREALASVVEQSERDWEAIVVDNESDDETIAVVDSFGDPRIRLVSFRNHGIIAASRNKGIGMARADWVAFLDSDDFWRPKKLELSLGAADPETDLICHREATVRAGKVRGVSPHYRPKRAQYRRLLFEGTCFSPTAVLVRRCCLDEVGGFSEDPEIVTCEDYDLWLRLAKAGIRVNFIEPVLSEYRLHADNATSAVETHMLAALEVMARHYESLRKRRPLDAMRYRRQRASFVYAAGRSFQLAGNRATALRYFTHSAVAYPFLPKMYVAAVMALLPGGSFSADPAQKPAVTAAAVPPLALSMLWLWIVLATALYLHQFRYIIEAMLGRIGFS